MFDRHQGGEQALLVHVYFDPAQQEEELDEFQSLASSAGAEVKHIVIARCHQPQAKYFVGLGKAQEIADAVDLFEADLVIVNHALTPAQTRNIEQLCQCRVVDRTGLILDIFAQRARTHEGKLQVELAQLRYLSTRLIRGWTHLERQKGGIGLRGPGETQLETDRRLLRERISHIQQRLEKVSRQREQNRRSRKKAEIPTLSLVGYTNAGKSTLFNRLTESDVYAADQLFATLDPTLRRLEIEDIGVTIFADTVGFIRHLPHDLVAAFKATLQETREATLLLHVVDAGDTRKQENILAVEEVLKEIDADEIPLMLVMNKIDQLEGFTPRIDYDDNGLPCQVWVSAQSGEGIDLLHLALRQRLADKQVDYLLNLPPREGKLRSMLYQLGAVKSELIDEQGYFQLQIRMPSIEWLRLKKQENKIDSFIQ